ncbi:MAG: thiamine phosphate synthase [Bacteroidales bacterium]|nr:thiamine phosphate synthase [Bacteroidales bacterium]
MKLIAITQPSIIEGESSYICRLFESGIDIVHLRKPDADIEQCRRLLRELSDEERRKIVIHDHHELINEFELKGLHFNKNITIVPGDYKGFKTRSCHSFEEVMKYKNDYDYLFLSPIFDSISKVGYKSAFTDEILREASSKNIIDNKVVALGGVTIDKIPYLKELNFGGAAMMGALVTRFIKSRFS